MGQDRGAVGHLHPHSDDQVVKRSALSHDGSASATSGVGAGRGRVRVWLSLWVPSQNGASRDLPHRHRAMICRFLGTTAPSGSTISTGPRTSNGPSGQMVI